MGKDICFSVAFVQATSNMIQIKKNNSSLQGFHGGDYEECHLLGCVAMCFL
jgi:hypothetical protein